MPVAFTLSPSAEAPIDPVFFAAAHGGGALLHKAARRFDARALAQQLGLVIFGEPDLGEVSERKKRNKENPQKPRKTEIRLRKLKKKKKTGSEAREGFCVLHIS